MALIAVVKRKGGSGASTVAASLAGAWDAQGKRVVLLDSDPQLSCVTWGRIADDEGATLARVTRAAVFEDDTHLREVIDKARHEAERVIIDTRPGLHVQALEVAADADVVVLPCGPSPLDLAPLRDMLRVVKRIRGDRARPAVAIVPTRYTHRTRLGRELPESLADLAAQLELPAVVTPGLSYRVGYGECVLMGQTPEEYGDAIRDEARELAEVVEGML